MPRLNRKVGASASSFLLLMGFAVLLFGGSMHPAHELTITSFGAVMFISSMVVVVFTDYRPHRE